MAVSFFWDIFQIVLIDLSMAADNALAIGVAVSGLPPAQKRHAMAGGIAAATVLRILMAIFAVQLLHIAGLTLAGGLLLAWVAWKMFCDFHHTQKHGRAAPRACETVAQKRAAAIWRIVIADVSMSLDNVLAVAGVARDHIPVLAAGLLLSVVLMGFAASQIARLTERYPKLALIAVAIVAVTAVNMIFDGAGQVGFVRP